MIHITLDYHTMTSRGLPLPDRSGYNVRHAARAVVFDASGAVGLLHATRDNYYKLPGGGIEEGEDIATALDREIQEELGCKAKVGQQIGVVVEHRDFWQLNQTSAFFVADVVGKKGKPAFTGHEIEEGFKVVWVPSIPKALELIRPGTTNHDLPNVLCMSLRDTAILKAVATLRR